MLQEGWVAYWRGYRRHPLFIGEPFSRAEAFWWFVERAAYARRVEVHDGRDVFIEPGQVSASIRDLAEEFGWEKTRVERLLKKLVDRKMVEVETATGRTIITVCNYAKYQPSQWDDATAARQQRDTSATAARHSIKRKEGNKEIIEPSPDGDGSPAPGLFEGKTPAVAKGLRPSKAATTWPEGFEISPKLRAYAIGNGIAEDRVDRVFAHFENHHRAKGSRFKDWPAAFRTWVLNQDRFRPAGNGVAVRDPNGHHPMVQRVLDDIGKPAIEEDRFWKLD